MDHNLDDSLNLESDMGVDFEQSDDAVVSQVGMTLEHSGHEESIPMEFEHSEEQSILMDTGSEEIIDFMGDQFTIQEYSVQSDQTTGLTTTVESNQNILTSQSDTMIDLQLQSQIMTSIKQEQVQPQIITVQTVPSPVRSSSARKNDSAVLTTVPRQVAIAPKPPKLAIDTFGKSLAIAPKPVTVVANRGHSLVKKVSLGNVVQGTSKGNTVLAKIGKQLIMVPSGAQQIKLVSASGGLPVQYVRADPEQAQLISTKSLSGSQAKPIMTKLITVQGGGQSGSDPANQPAVITKLVGGKPQRFVAVPHKAVPISVANKVLLTTPSKQPVKLNKKQEIIAIKPPAPKLLPALAPGKSPSSTTNKQKVVISTNPNQNVILKTTAPPKTLQMAKDGSIVVEGQRTQLHQINVPGKGIQYIRLITNSSTPKLAPKPLVTVPSKTFVLADNKGNLIQMSGEKISTTQAPSLVMTSAASTTNRLTGKPQQKLVRIAPIVPKTTQATMQPSRSSQSLLAPLSPILQPEATESGDTAAEEEVEQMDSKAALRALIEDTVAEEQMTEVEVEVEYKRQPSPDDSRDGTDQHDSSGRSDEHPLIVIPPGYDQTLRPEDDSTMDDSQKIDEMIERNLLTSLQTSINAQSESEFVSTELGMRPRKACNCTKSQCLKLYCDCFANGEFCNRCNCNNCHNNLENEELRQKAIRGCLDRNPDAFRPKIGKATVAGPDMVRMHNKGCNCKRSGCLKNYCECYEAKIACTAICKCVGCRNVVETLERGRRRPRATAALRPAPPPAHSLCPTPGPAKQPCNFMTSEVIEAVCQCLIAAASDEKEERDTSLEADPMRDVIEEFARCLQDIISAARQSTPLAVMDEGPA